MIQAMQVDLFPSVRVGVAVTASYIALVYLTLPYAPGFIRFLAGAGFLGAFIAFVGITIATLLLFGGVRSGRIKTVACWLAYGWLGLVYYLAAAYTVGLAERLHLWLYAVLGFLMFSLIRHWRRGWSLSLWAVAATALFGAVDEGIQYLLPNRHFSVDDIILNGIGGISAIVITRYVLGDNT